jgi:xylulokinase
MAFKADRLVIGLDSSTQSTKAILWDRAGRLVAKGSAPISLSNPARDQFVQDPEEWWQSCCAALESCLKQVDASRVDAMAIVHQRETVAFLDPRAKSIYPAIVWLDERARSNVTSFSKAIGVETIHRITGRYPDLTPTIYPFRLDASARTRDFRAHRLFCRRAVLPRAATGGRSFSNRSVER